MNKKYFIFITLSFFLYTELYAMGERVKYTEKDVVTYNGKKYVGDYVHWSGFQWDRVHIALIDNDKSVNDDNLVAMSQDDANVYDKIVFERPDLIKLGVHYSPYSNREGYYVYHRRLAKKIKIVTDPEKLKKKYVRLGTFTAAGPTPPNWKKVKDLVQAEAYGQFGADAVIVERWEVLPFKQEDYWPITTFQEPEYVRYYCIAVAFEESAAIPESEKEKYKDIQERVNKGYEEVQRAKNNPELLLKRPVK